MRTKPVHSPANFGPSPRLRQYLYLTAATTGMVIMIVEILGAKMLAPYVGTSHFVWTAQIAVTLVALSAGYYAGGKLADRSQELRRLYWAILLAAVYLCLTVLIVRPVAFWCVLYPLEIGSLLASTILFFVPLALLAMVGPFFVRVLTSAVTNVGGNVGRLTSIGTLGSFLGTILIGYVLIPHLPNSSTMYLAAGLLMAVAAGYFAGWDRKGAHPVAALFVLIAGLGAGYAGVANDGKLPMPGWTAAFRGNSNFGQLLVIDFEQDSVRKRLYLNDLLCQNTYLPATHDSDSMFTYMLHGLARAYATNLDDALCIGMGVGIVPRELLRDGARVDVVEINPAVVPIAQNLFDCPTDKLHITLGDGRQFLNRCPRKYDAVVLDAFLGDSSPAHLMTREAFAAVRHVLKPGGVLVINTFGELEAKHDFMAASLSKTLKSVFAGVKIHYYGMGNMLFVASDRADLEFAHAPDFSRVNAHVRGEVEEAFAETPDTDPASGIVLTDDYNPVEFYDAHNREDLRRRLVANWKTK